MWFGGRVLNRILKKVLNCHWIPISSGLKIITKRMFIFLHKWVINNREHMFEQPKPKYLVCHITLWQRKSDNSHNVEAETWDFLVNVACKMTLLSNCCYLFIFTELNVTIVFLISGHIISPILHIIFYFFCIFVRDIKYRECHNKYKMQYITAFIANLQFPSIAGHILILYRYYYCFFFILRPTRYPHLTGAYTWRLQLLLDLIHQKKPRGVDGVYSLYWVCAGCSRLVFLR